MLVAPCAKLRFYCLEVGQSRLSRALLPRKIPNFRQVCGQKVLDGLKLIECIPFHTKVWGSNKPSKVSKILNEKLSKSHHTFRAETVFTIRLNFQRINGALNVPGTAESAMKAQNLWKIAKYFAFFEANFEPLRSRVRSEKSSASKLSKKLRVFTWLWNFLVVYIVWHVTKWRPKKPVRDVNAGCLLGGIEKSLHVYKNMGQVRFRMNWSWPMTSARERSCAKSSNALLQIHPIFSRHSIFQNLTVIDGKMAVKVIQMHEILSMSKF